MPARRTLVVLPHNHVHAWSRLALSVSLLLALLLPPATAQEIPPLPTLPQPNQDDVVRGYHAQFTFDPLLDADSEGLEFFDLSLGRVVITTALYDDEGEPMEFAAGPDPVRARLILTSEDQSPPPPQPQRRISLPGVVNDHQPNVATFIVDAADLLPLQQARTPWLLQVESPNPTPAPLATFEPEERAYYNSKAEEAFAADPQLADELDTVPTPVIAAIEPTRLRLDLFPEAVRSNEPFDIHLTLLDQVGRPITATPYDVRLEQLDGPSDGLSAQDPNATANQTRTVNGVAKFDDRSLDIMGVHHYEALVEDHDVLLTLPELAVQAGDVVELRLADANGVEVESLELTSDDQRVLQLLGLDAAGNLAGPVPAQWSVLDNPDVATIVPATSETMRFSQVLLNASKVGSARLLVVDAAGRSITLEDLEVSAGQPHHLAVDNGPEAQSVGATHTVSYRAKAYDADGNLLPVGRQAMSWSVDPATGGAFEGDLFTPSGSAGTYTIRARLATDASVSGTSLFHVHRGPVHKLDILSAPASATLDGAAITFTARAEDHLGNAHQVDAANDVTWSIDPSDGGSFNKNVLTPGKRAGLYVVRAVLKADDTVADQVDLSLRPGAAKQLAITTGNVNQVAAHRAPIAYAAQALDAHGNTIPLDSAADVLWSLSPGYGGTFASNVLTPSGSLGSFQVSASLKANNALKAEATFTLTSQRIASIMVANGDVQQRIGALSPVSYTVSAKDETGAHVDLDPAQSIQWSIDNTQGGAFAQNVLTPGETKGVYVITAALKGRTEIKAQSLFEILPGKAVRLEIANGAIVMAHHHASRVQLQAEAYDARDNLVEALPKVRWSADPEAGRFDGDAFIPKDAAGRHLLVAELLEDPNVRGETTLTIVGALDDVMALRPGQASLIRFMLPDDVESAEAIIVDGAGGPRLLAAQLQRDAEGHWAGTFESESELAGLLRVVYVQDGESHSLDIGEAAFAEKKKTPAVGFVLVLAVLGLFALARRRD